MQNKDTKVYTEIGIGNPTLINTEIEYPDGTEIRKPGFQKMKIIDLCFRVWLDRKVYIISTKDGFKIQKNPRTDFKILIGIQGIG